MIENTCMYCQNMYIWNGVTFQYTNESKYKYNAKIYCSYECHKKARIDKRKQNIEEKHGSMSTFNNWKLRRLIKQLKEQGISIEGIEEYKNTLMQKESISICIACNKEYMWNNIKIHKVPGKKKGYNAQKYCSYICYINTKNLKRQINI